MLYILKFIFKVVFYSGFIVYEDKGFSEILLCVERVEGKVKYLILNFISFILIFFWKFKCYVVCNKLRF